MTNPREAKLLKSSAYRQRIADALFEAIRTYQASLKKVPTVAHQSR
jgi:N-acetylmuramoyl-L-alanine amidase